MPERLPDSEAWFEHAACALLLTGVDGVILRANASACTWLGYTQDELAGKLRMIDLLPVGARLFFHTHCLPILQTQGSVAEIQIDLRNRAGARLPMLMNIVRRRDGERELDHWALFIAKERRAYERELLDARKAAEAALEARRGAEAQLQALNDQLSDADRRKDEFLATLSHELRNPLAPMRSALDVLKLKYGQSGEQRLLQACDRQLRHLTRLVDDLMEVSRITQGRMQLQCAPLDLGVLVRGAAQDMAAMIGAARHTLHMQVPEQPVPLYGDATRLGQVVINLLTNAAKYTPDGGRIDLSLACESGCAVVRVRDNGIGIAAEALVTVFEMFSQLEPALERARGGLGIGLALVRGIVALHEGSVHAESAGAGCGSQFTIRLPLAQDAAQTQAASLPAMPQRAAPLRILVVDDNRDAAETLMMALELYGLETAVAHDAAGALALAAAFRPQAALLDIGLPDMNGYELAGRLRRMPGLDAGLLLIAATGWGQDKDRQRAFAAGFDHHLTKPIDFDNLRSLLPGAAR